MREMKDSGIEWIGKIPVDWKVSKIKYVADFFNGDRGKNYPSGADLVDEGIIFLTSNNVHGVELDCTPQISKFITEDRYTLLGGAKICKGDIIYCLRGSVGNCAINKTEKRGTVASSLVDIRPIRVIHEFLNYYLQSPANFIQTLAYMNGSCAANLSAENVANYYFLEPPLKEQQALVAFLDSKCAEIDALTADIQSQIDTLEQYKRSVITEAVTKGLNPDAEMRDSGMRWVDKLPSHWDVIPSKYLFRNSDLRKRAGDVQLTASQNWGIIPQEEYMERTGTKIVLANQGLENWKHIEPDDFVISLRSFQGGLELSTVTGCITWHYVVLKATRPIVSRFYKWLFKSDVYIAALQGTCNFIRDGQDLRYSNFSQVPLYIPPMDEQRQIANYLDDRCSTVDTIIAEKRTQKNALEQYKKSLIFEYVTGKKEM